MKYLRTFCPSSGFRLMLLALSQSAILCYNTEAFLNCGHGVFHRTKPRLPCRSRSSTGLVRSRSDMTMGLQIKIRIVGRKNGSEKWLEDAYSMYETRLRPSNIDVETIWHKSDNELVKGIETDKTKGHSVVLLDPKGKTRTSEEFSTDMYNWLDQGGSRLAFVIGGAEGLPPVLRSNRNKAGNMLSLSALTFTHQFARTLLMEQIYRASEIRKGSGYHK